MEIVPLAIPDAYRIIPRRLPDARGCFYESFKHGALAEATGRDFTLRQVNNSVSRRGVVRGIHGVLIPPGQAKIVGCARGAIRDFVVDLRVGSPTFGRSCVNVLEAGAGTSVFIAEGLGHAFVTLADDTCVTYLCSTEYVPGTQIDIAPFDPALGLPWDLDGEPILSEKDARAPTAAQAADAGLLPAYARCRELYARSRTHG